MGVEPARAEAAAESEDAADGAVACGVVVVGAVGAWVVLLAEQAVSKQSVDARAAAFTIAILHRSAAPAWHQGATSTRNSLELSQPSVLPHSTWQRPSRRSVT